MKLRSPKTAVDIPSIIIPITIEFFFPIFDSRIPTIGLNMNPASSNVLNFLT